MKIKVKGAKGPPGKTYGKDPKKMQWRNLKDFKCPYCAWLLETKILADGFKRYNCTNSKCTFKIAQHRATAIIQTLYDTKSKYRENPDELFGDNSQLN